MNARKILFLSLWVLVCHPCWLSSLQGQPYAEARTRHRFAQLTLGSDVTFHPAGGSSEYLTENGRFMSRGLPSQLGASIWIGGLHFWGHMDFAIRVPLVRQQLTVAEGPASRFLPGTETIAKVYPWAIRTGKARPFVGVAAQAASFQQGHEDDRGPMAFRMTTPLLAGFTYLRGNHLWEAGANVHFQRSLSYPLSRDEMGAVQLPPLALSLGYRWMIETTLSAEPDWQSGRTAARTQALADAGKLNSWYFGVGPSSAWLLTSHPGLSESHPSLLLPVVESVFPDFVGGYYLHRPDLNLGLSYRPISSRTSAYGLAFRQQRHSLSAEVAKFVGDYHGFAPFIGPAVSYEWLSASLTDGDTPVFDKQWQGIRPGIVVGWDIRPTRLQSFYLRTNLRYFPNLGIPQAGEENIPFHQLEINFIQLVLMLDRL